MSTYPGSQKSCCFSQTRRSHFLPCHQAKIPLPLSPSLLLSEYSKKVIQNRLPQETFLIFRDSKFRRQTLPAPSPRPSPTQWWPSCDRQGHHYLKSTSSQNSKAVFSGSRIRKRGNGIAARGFSPDHHPHRKPGTGDAKSKRSHFQWCLPWVRHWARSPFISLASCVLRSSRREKGSVRRFLVLLFQTKPSSFPAASAQRASY